MKHMCRLCSFALLAFAASTLVSSPASAENSVLEWAPDNSVLFLGMANWDESVEAFKKTRSYRSMEDPEVNEAIQPWKKLAENAQSVIAKKLGLEDPKELEVRPHGGVAVFLPVDMEVADAKEQLQACLVTDMGQDAERLRAIAGKAVQRCVENGAERTAEESGGTEIITITFKSARKGESDANTSADVKSESTSESESEAESEAEGDPKQPSWIEPLLEGVELDNMQLVFIKGLLGDIEPPDRFAFAFAGTRLVLGSNLDTVKKTLARLRGGSEGSLAAHRDMRAFARRIEGRSDLLFVVNIPVIVNAASKEEAEARRILPALGMDAFGPLIMNVQLAPSQQVDVRIRGFLRIDDKPHGLGRILKMQNIDTAPPSGVSEDTALYASLNIDPSLVLDEVIAISEQIDPNTAETIRGSLKIPQDNGPDLDVKADIVGQLVGPLAFSLGMAKPFDAEHLGMLVRLGHKSRDAITKLAAMLPQPMFAPSEMLGHTVYRTPMLEGAALGFTDRAVIPFATTNALESYIRSEGQPGRGLAQTPAFQSIARHVPAQSSAMVYVDGPLLLDAQIALAEEAAAGKAAQPEKMTMHDYLRMGMSQSVSPTQVKLLKASRKYANSAIATMATEPDGLLFDCVQVPAAEKPAE